MGNGHYANSEYLKNLRDTSSQQFWPMKATQIQAINGLVAF